MGRQILSDSITSICPWRGILKTLEYTLQGSFRLLMNEAYIGVYHFSDTRIEGGMPALIDQGTFWAANERLKANSSVRGRHQDGGDYLLTGKLKCAHCGSYMIGFSGTGKSGELHYYYGCQKRRRERACKKANVPREWIERVVVKAALDYVLRPDVMEWIADAVMEYQEREAASAQLAALTAELEENQKATDNVMKAIEAGIITSTTKQRLLDLEAKAQDLKRAIELEKLSHVRLERDQVLFWLDRFRGGSLQSQEFRRKVIDAFVSVVYLFDDHLRIAFNYSGGSNAEADFDLHGMAIVPENRRLFAPMTVRENLEMGAYTRRSRAEIDEDMQRAFTLFPRLKEREKQAGGTLSGGEQQMLAVGRALMSRPKLLLLDEPSMGLAPMLIQQIFDIIVEINQQGTTVLLVEQNAQQALSRAHRAYVLETGRIVKEGTGAELLHDPAVKDAYLGVA